MFLLKHSFANYWLVGVMPTTKKKSCAFEEKAAD